MTFWSGEKLEERLGQEGLITPFEPSQIDCASYQLKLGSEVYISPASEAKEPNQTTIRRLSGDDEAFTIPSGQFAFLMTEELIKVPADGIAFISIRATVKFRGLVNVSGFHVDPGYSGRLIFSVFNAGPAPVHLKRGDTCFLIWYADLDRTSAKLKDKAGYNTIPAALINPIAGGIQSFEGVLGKIKEVEKKLDDRVQKVEKDHVKLVTIGGLLLSLVGAFLLRSVWPASVTEKAIPERPAVEMKGAERPDKEVGPIGTTAPAEPDKK